MSTEEPRRAPLRGSPRGRRATLAVGAPRVLGATADAFFLRVDQEVLVGEDASCGAIVCLDGREVSSRWTARFEGLAPSAFALRGDGLLRAEGRELALHEGKTGEVVSRADLPLRASGLFVEGDRALVVLSGPKGVATLLAVDLSAHFGEALWRHELARGGAVELAVANGRVHVSRRGEKTIAVLDLATGAAQAPIELGADERLVALHGGDEHGVLLTLFQGDRPTLEERSPSGATLWRHDTLFKCLAVTKGLIVGVTPDESGGPGDVVLGLEREKGHITWMQELAAHAPGVAPAQRIAVVEDVVYVGTAGAKISVTAYELAAGTTIFERSFALPVDMEPVGLGPKVSPVAFGIAPLHESIALVVGSEGETVVALLSP